MKLLESQTNRNKGHNARASSLMSAEEAEEATPGTLYTQHHDDVRQRFRIAYRLRRLYTDQSRRSGPAKTPLRVWRAQQFAPQRLQLSFDSASAGRSVDPTLSSPSGAVRRPRRIPAVSKPLVIGVGRVCHELFLVVTAPSHGCKGVLYCTIPNPANALHEPTRDESDENRLTRTIARHVSRNYKPIRERAIFVERARDCPTSR